MRRTLILFVFVSVLISGTGCDFGKSDDSNDAAATATLKVFNNMGLSTDILAQLFISENIINEDALDDPSWGSDLIAASADLEPMGAGNSWTITGIAPGYYDVLVRGFDSLNLTFLFYDFYDDKYLVGGGTYSIVWTGSFDGSGADSAWYNYDYSLKRDLK